MASHIKLIFNEMLRFLRPGGGRGIIGGSGGMAASLCGTSDVSYRVCRPGVASVMSRSEVSVFIRFFFFLVDNLSVFFFFLAMGNGRLCAIPIAIFEAEIAPPPLCTPDGRVPEVEIFFFFPSFTFCMMNRN